MSNYDENYNPSADPAFDEAPFTEGENAVEDQDAEVVDADSSVERAVQEDRDAEQTDSHGQPSKFEVDTLLSDVREDERGVSGGIRGKKVDAYKQERELDRVTGLAGDDA